jgi:hypothetical protein
MTGHARMAAGSYPLGDGWVIQVVATDAETINVRCCIDPAWLPADQAAFESHRESSPVAGHPSSRPYSFRGRPLLMGVTQCAEVGSGLALEWRDRGEVVHVHIGSPGDDRFMRASDATRCLYLGFGGNDRVVVPGFASESATGSGIGPVQAVAAHANSPMPLPNDRMVKADRSLGRVLPETLGGTTNMSITMEGD